MVASQTGEQQMCFDIAKEKLIRLADVPKLKWLPRRRAGSRLSIATVYRWEQRPNNPLEAVRVGGTLCTTEAALMRFFERQANPTTAPHIDHSAAHADAERELEMAGI
jgi:hypothetical protein